MVCRMDRSASFDVLVVGGGSAGCVLAARLAENGRRIGLIEAGPDYGSYEHGRWPEDMLDGRALAFSHAWETDREDRSQLRARIMGGCSAHNACVMLAGAPADYDEWGHSWSHGAIEPYLRRAERQMRVRRLTTEELSPWHRAFVETCGEAAIVHPVHAVGTVRWNTAFAYLDPVRARDNLTILADTLVDRVLLDGDRAIGVATTVGEVRARTVVLAAGAYGSPGILLRSGVGPDRGLPVGDGLIDHVGVGFGYEGTDRMQVDVAAFERAYPLFMAQVTIAMSSSACAAGVSDLFLFPGLDPPGPHGYEVSVAVFAMKPASRHRSPVCRPRDAPRSGGRRDDARANDRAWLLPPRRDLRDRAGGRRPRPRLRARWARCRRCVDHADDPARQHEPLHHRAGRADCGHPRPHLTAHPRAPDMACPQRHDAREFLDVRSR
jgi:choline dehydrogenase